VAKLTLEQASLSGGQIARLMNGLHFALAKSLFRMTAGRLSIAGKEFYLAVKTGSSLVPVRSALEMV
jgi:hypothetical protein